MNQQKKMAAIRMSAQMAEATIIKPPIITKIEGPPPETDSNMIPAPTADAIRQEKISRAIGADRGIPNAMIVLKEPSHSIEDNKQKKLRPGQQRRADRRERRADRREKRGERRKERRENIKEGLKNFGEFAGDVAGKGFDFIKDPMGINSTLRTGMYIAGAVAGGLVLWAIIRPDQSASIANNAISTAGGVASRAI